MTIFRIIDKRYLFKVGIFSADMKFKLLTLKECKENIFKNTFNRISLDIVFIFVYITILPVNVNDKKIKIFQLKFMAYLIIDARGIIQRYLTKDVRYL